MNVLRSLLQNLRPPSGGGGGGGAVGGLIGAVAGVAVLGYGAYYSVYTVQGGHRAIIYNRIGGIGKDVKSEGLQFVIPWFQRPIVFDVRTRPKLIQSNSGSKDLQTVQISLRVLYKPNPHALPFIYRMLGTDFDERVLPSIVNEVTKAVIARYNAAELLTKRDQVSRNIRDQLVQRASDFEIVLDDVSITHLAFSKEYTAAVEAKQVAQQEAERAKYIVEKAIQEKETIKIKADAEATSAKLIGDAIRENPGFLALRRIEAAKDVANMVANGQSRVFVDSDTLLLNALADSTDTLTKMEHTPPAKKGYW